MPLSLRYTAHSEIGLVRKNNQDSGYASAHLLMVADGMGGAAAGDLASAVAVTRLRALDQELSGAADAPVGEDLLSRVTQRVHDANELIADLAADNPALDGMGTTVTAAAFDGHDLAVVHIGDSRMYRLRRGSFVRVTHDHSWVQSLVDEGRLTPEQAATHPHRSLLLRVLNGAPNNDPDVGLVDAAAGDRLLLCSDGLCGLVDDTDLARMVAVPDRADALAQLIAAAHAAGGSDNITIILADVVAVPNGHIPPIGETVPDNHALSAGATPPTGAVPTGGALSAEDAVPLTVGAAATRDIPPVSERTQEIPLDPAQFVAPLLVDAEGRPIPEDVASQAQALEMMPARHDIEPRPVVVAARAATRTAAPRRMTPEDARYAPREDPPVRRRALVTLISVLIAVLLVAGAAVGTWAVWHNSYFVGADGGKVAIYRGFDATIGPWQLSRMIETEDIAIADLSPRYQQQVHDSITVASLPAAHASTAELAQNATYCRTLRAQADAAAADATRRAEEEAKQKAAELAKQHAASPSAPPPAVPTPTPVVPDYGDC